VSIMPGAERGVQVETILREWLNEPAITIMCGDWRNGCIMELLPEGRATLTKEKYPAPFAGLRDIELPGQAHHLHLNLDKLTHVVYAIAPCVCYGYRPSFEVRFDDTEQSTTAFAVAIRQPYLGRRTNRPALTAYFRRMIDHLRRFPTMTSFQMQRNSSDSPLSTEGWNEILNCFMEARDSERISEDSISLPECLRGFSPFEAHRHG
jgi:hypothetical protein